jgi:hypothetical protein
MSTMAAMAGEWLGNGLVMLGVLLLALRVYTSRKLSHIRHVKTGQPLPGPDYIYQLLPARFNKPPLDPLGSVLRRIRAPLRILSVTRNAMC